MICSKCGAMNNSNTQFCVNCGNQLISNGFVNNQNIQQNNYQQPQNYNNTINNGYNQTQQVSDTNMYQQPTNTMSYNNTSQPINNDFVSNNQMNTNSFVSNNSVSLKKNKKNKKLLIIFCVIVLLLGVGFVVYKMINKEDKSSLSETDNIIQGNYISLNIPLTTDLILEAPYIKKTIRTLFYDENKNVTRVIFTDIYDNNTNAKNDYNSMVNSNANWGFTKTYIDVKDNVLTYEYSNETLEEYYSDFIDNNIDEIIEDYGEDKIVKDFVPNISGTANTNNSTDNEAATNNSNVNYDNMISQIEKKLGDNVTKYYQESTKEGYTYVATVDRESIEYTDKFTPGEKYYVMEVTARNTSTNIAVSKYYARCKWNSVTNTIEEYGDNTRIIITLGIYETVLEGSLVISEDEYTKDYLWNTTDTIGSNLKDIFAPLDELNYFYYDHLSSKDESMFETMKNTKIADLKKILTCNSVKVHLAQIVTNDELSYAFNMANYINNDLYLGKKENIESLIEHLKNGSLYHEETINLS